MVIHKIKKITKKKTINQAPWTCLTHKEHHGHFLVDE